MVWGEQAAERNTSHQHGIHNRAEMGFNGGGFSFLLLGRIWRKCEEWKFTSIVKYPNFPLREPLTVGEKEDNACNKMRERMFDGPNRSIHGREAVASLSAEQSHPSIHPHRPPVAVGRIFTFNHFNSQIALIITAPIRERMNDSPRRNRGIDSKC